MTELAQLRAELAQARDRGDKLEKRAHDAEERCAKLVAELRDARERLAAMRTALVSR